MSNAGYSRKTVDVKQIHSNVDQQLIQITEDKLENILIKQLKFMNIKNSWVNPASILIAIVTAMTTATFKDSFGISANQWEALFTVVGLLSGGWLVRNIVLILKNYNTSSIKYLISTIKNSDNDNS
jgi:hypothetical protein